MIVCPNCSSTKSLVSELKSKPGLNRRYRTCKDCGHRFVTHENLVDWQGHIKGWDTTKGPLEASE
jgi:transcriptional regulator NrdR family protein